ncbi:NAD(P)-binding protein [Poronia punctata]|nr:NAD(P)-binding protein [Poronia punctata]
MSRVSDLSLTGKVAIITGSGRPNGIGSAIAKTLAARGLFRNHKLHISDSSASGAASVAETIRSEGGKATVVRADVGDKEEAERLVRETLLAFGTDKIDILEITSVFSANLNGPFFLVQAAIPHMARNGRIINISTCLSRMGLHSPVYTASKAALDSLTYTWALEFGKEYGITVNTIAPGLTKTNKTPPNDHPEVKRLLGLSRLEERMGTVDEIADAVLLVASPLSGWITGQYISVSGGG